MREQKANSQTTTSVGVDSGFRAKHKSGVDGRGIVEEVHFGK
jgi:hypothetical protein